MGDNMIFKQEEFEHQFLEPEHEGDWESYSSSLKNYFDGDIQELTLKDITNLFDYAAASDYTHNRSLREYVFTMSMDNENGDIDYSLIMYPQ